MNDRFNPVFIAAVLYLVFMLGFSVQVVVAFGDWAERVSQLALK